MHPPCVTIVWPCCPDPNPKGVDSKPSCNKNWQRADLKASCLVVNLSWWTKSQQKSKASSPGCPTWATKPWAPFLKTRSEEHTSELQSRPHLVCRLLLEKKNYTIRLP